MSDKLKGVFIMLSASLFFSLMGLFAKNLKGSCSAYQVVFFRSLITFFVVLITARIRKVSVWGNNKKILLMRGTFGGIALIFFFTTILHLKLANAFILNKTSPAFAAVFSIWFLKERFNWKKLVSLIMTLTGVYLVINPVYNFSTGDNFYSFLGLLSGILSAAAYVCVKKARDTENTETIVVYFASMATIFTVIPALSGSFELFSLKICIYLFLVGFFSSFAQLLMTLGYAYLSVSEATIISSVTIINTVLIGFFIFDERLSTYAIIGAILVIMAIAIISLSREKAQRKIKY